MWSSTKQRSNRHFKMLRAWMCVAGLLILSISVSGKRKVFDLHQTDYVMAFERMELGRLNTKAMPEFNVRTFKYNRTTPLVNMTKFYNINLGNELQIIVQAYKFASNEYRTFPIRMEVNFCDVIRTNLIGCGRFLKCGNFTGCPILKHTRYHYCNWSPDESQFPPYVPNGHYMLELQGLYHSEELWVLNAFGTISRPLK